MIPNFLVPEDAQSSAQKKDRVQLLSPVLPGQEPFKEALLEKAFAAHRRTPLDWVAAMAVHVAIVAAIVILPLYFTQRMDMVHFQATLLASPPSPLASPPPPPSLATPSAHPHAAKLSHPNVLLGELREPIAIPKAIEKPTVAEETPPPEVGIGIPGGVIGGVPGGVLGGIVGGISGTGSPSPAPPPPAAETPSGPLRIGGEVKRPRLMYSTPPEYPLLAKTARVQGTVEIEAVIDEHGNVVKAHAMDGPALLIEAALKAVSQWKYEPTYLNGQPYPVDLTIQVTFSLG